MTEMDPLFTASESAHIGQMWIDIKDGLCSHKVVGHVEFPVVSNRRLARQMLRATALLWHGDRGKSYHSPRTRPRSRGGEANLEPGSKRDNRIVGVRSGCWSDPRKETEHGTSCYNAGVSLGPCPS